MEHLRQLAQAKQAQLLSCNNIVGVGVGHKRRRGRVVENEAIVVLVRKKLDPIHVPKAVFIPRQIEDVPTDVVEVGDLRILAGATRLPRAERMRPARPGVSIGHYKITAGTFGCVVRDLRTNATLILSNNHVLANLSDGFDGRARIGDAVLQPGRYDGGTDKDLIATLERFIPLYRVNRPPTCRIARKLEQAANFALRILGPSYEVHFQRRTRVENLADAAVARPVKEEEISPDILGIGSPKGVKEVSIDDVVMKSGRTSGLTRGRVEVVHATVKVALGDVGYGIFSDQIVTTQIGDPGDSGSLVLSPDGMAVGLLSAGSDRATICGRIQNVLSSLGVELAT